MSPGGVIAVIDIGKDLRHPNGVEPYRDLYEGRETTRTLFKERRALMADILDLASD